MFLAEINPAFFPSTKAISVLDNLMLWWDNLIAFSFAAIFPLRTLIKAVNLATSALYYFSNLAHSLFFSLCSVSCFYY